jgi:hypothetical protein
MKKNTSLVLLLVFTLLFTLFAGCVPITPQTVEGLLTGFVAMPDSGKDLTGYTPVPGATVTVTDAEGITHTTITDETGLYTFSGFTINLNTIIHIEKTTDTGILQFKDIVPLVLTESDDYDAGIADALSTATALVLEKLIEQGYPREDIDLAAIILASGFDNLTDSVSNFQAAGQPVTSGFPQNQAIVIANNILNPVISLPAAKTGKDIISCQLNLSPAVTGIIDSENHTISFVVPYGTDVTSLVATFTLSESASVKIGVISQVSGTTQNDFTHPVTYTVIAENATTQDWIVTVEITLGPLDHFTLTGYPVSTTAGQAFVSPIILTAYDGMDRVKTDYTDSVYFTSTDIQAELPYTADAKYTFTAEDVGIATFAANTFNLKTSGTKTLTVTNGTVSVTSNDISVTPGALSAIKIEDAAGGVGNEVDTSTLSSGDTLTLYATDYDIFGNYIADQIVTWSGSGICSTNLNPTFGASTTFTSVTAGDGTVMAHHASAADDTTGTITVNAAAAHHFKISGPSSVYAGSGNTITIKAYDEHNNIATGYTGSKSLVFSGAQPSPNPVNHPTCSNIAFGNNITIQFANGAGTTVMELYKAEEAAIKVTRLLPLKRIVCRSQ